MHKKIGYSRGFETLKETEQYHYSLLVI